MAARVKKSKTKKATRKPPNAGRVPGKLTLALGTTSFADYTETLASLKSFDAWPEKIGPSGRGRTTFVVADLLLLLRPYYWYVSSPGFQDLMDAATTAHAALVKNAKLLREELSVSGLPQFLEGYVNHESLDGTGWAFLACSPELAAALDAEACERRLKRARKPKDAKALGDLAHVLKAVEGAKHQTYWALRVVGASFLDQLEGLIHKLAPGDQGFVLHALDEFVKNKQVIAFYKRFIAETTYDTLKEEAAGYLERVR